jgi:hypothetical protein
MVSETVQFLENSELTLWPDKYWSRRKRRIDGLKKFSAATTMLVAIAEKQSAHLELTADETKFLQDIVVRNHNCGAPPLGGWYPQLYLQRSGGPERDDAHKWTALVTDIHTDPPDPLVSDPGCVLHEAVGNVDLLIIAIENGDDRIVYAGPVFSHYEFTTPAGVRLTNGEWQAQLREGKAPSREEAAGPYAVPGRNPETKDYGLNKRPW